MTTKTFKTNKHAIEKLEKKITRLSGGLPQYVFDRFHGSEEPIPKETDSVPEQEVKISLLKKRLENARHARDWYDNWLREQKLAKARANDNPFEVAAQAFDEF